MIFINAAKLYTLRLCSQFDLDFHRGGRGVLPRKVVQVLLGGQHGQPGVGLVAECRHAHLAVQRTGQFQPFVTGLPQQTQCVEDRLGDAVLRHHAEATVEFLWEGMDFLKNVAEAPDAGPVDDILRTKRRAHIVGSRLAGIVAGCAEGRAGAPLGIIQRQPLGLLAHHLGAVAQQITVKIVRFGVVGHRAAEHRQQAVFRL